MAGDISFAPPTIPIISNVTGEPSQAETVCSSDYWVSHVRKTVRFSDSIRWLGSQGVTHFLELGPDGGLSAATQDCLTVEAGNGPGQNAVADRRDKAPITTVALLRGDRPEVQELMTAVAHTWVHGTDVNWGALFVGLGARRVRLPTYAFQRERYWLTGGHGAGDASLLGQHSADHPLLGAVVELADERGWLFTGKLSLQSHPWLAHHAVTGTVLLPGTAFLELALAAGQRVGSSVIEELTLEAPLVFQGQDSVQVQIAVSVADDHGRCQLEIYSRVDDQLERPWTRHATGSLDLGDDYQDPMAHESGCLTEGWSPPEDAQLLDLEFLYDRLAEAGYDYGPSFQGLRGAFRLEDGIYAEVALDEEQSLHAGSFCIHPALLDSAFHALLLATLETREIGAIEVPFSFCGVRFHNRGASMVRVRMDTSSDALSVLVLDGQGAPVITIDSLTSRAVDQRVLRSASRSGQGLYEPQWLELAASPEVPAEDSSIRVALLQDGSTSQAASWEPATLGFEVEHHLDLSSLIASLEEDEEAPPLVLVDVEALLARSLGSSRRDFVESAHVHSVTSGVLGLLQGFVGVECLSGSRLVLVTRGALGVGGEVPDLVQAGLAGLLRSVCSEQPGRFAMIDVDGSESSFGALEAALSSGESELAIREGKLFERRLVRAQVQSDVVPLELGA